MFQAMMAAWISLVALAVEYEVVSDPGLCFLLIRELMPCQPISKLLPLPIADTTDPERLHPFRLALGLPRQSVTPLSHMFYRHISATQHSAQSDWSHAKCLGLAALVIAVEIVPDDATGKVTPSSIWDLSHRIVSDRVSKSDQARTLEEGEEIIARLVGWAETAISERKEERSKWFDGKAWLSLMDLWVGLARRVRSTSPLQLHDTILTEIAEQERRHRQSLVIYDRFDLSRAFHTQVVNSAGVPHVTSLGTVAQVQGRGKETGGGGDQDVR
jgi:hypothetical protein